VVAVLVLNHAFDFALGFRHHFVAHFNSKRQADQVLGLLNDLTAVAVHADFTHVGAQRVYDGRQPLLIA